MTCVEVSPCEMCGKARTPDEIHISISSNPGKCAVLTANAECPAWADGKHCYVLGFGPMNAVVAKTCVCGAEVKRA